MTEMTEVFCAPSLEWFKKKAKRLRKSIGRELITHTNALHLLARVYGYRDFSEYCECCENRMMGWTYPTVWDEELDANTLAERRFMQVSAVTAMLGISDEEATCLLEGIAASRTLPSREAAAEPDEILEFCSTLESMLLGDTLGQGVLTTTEACCPPPPVVTYKKSRTISHDVEKLPNRALVATIRSSGYNYGCKERHE